MYFKLINKLFKDIKINNYYYNLAKTWKIILARIFDLFLSSIIPIILTFIFFIKPSKNKIDNYFVFPFLLLLIGFICLIIYFLIIPYFGNSKTLGRLIFGILLYHENKIKFKHIFIREIFIIFIPWFIGITTNLLCCLIFKINIGKELDNNSNNIAQNSPVIWILKFTSTFYFIWYFIMIISIIFDKKNQVFYDYKMKIFMLSKVSKIEFIKNKNNKEINREKNPHIHLSIDQPGNINRDALDEIDELESDI